MCAERYEECLSCANAMHDDHRRMNKEEAEDNKLEYDGTRCKCGNDMFLVNEWVEKKGAFGKRYRYYGCHGCFRTQRIYI